MEALIWGNDSADGVDHGESCAAFASLTLELGARAAGQQSWVSGGTSYPWPLHQWADVRVDPNPDSLNVISVLQDAQSHNRWHPLGDGYQPKPGDWVLFDGHVEVVTAYSHGVLRTIGGDSLPNFSVNAHQYSGSLSSNGVAGFVNNGELLSAVSKQPGKSASQSSAGAEPVQNQTQASVDSSGGTQIPGLQIATAMTGTSSGAPQGQQAQGQQAQGQQAQGQRQRPRQTSTSAKAPVSAVAARATGSLAALNGVGTASTVNMPGTVAGIGTMRRAASAGTSHAQQGQTESSGATAAIPGVTADTVPNSSASTSPSAPATKSPAYTRNNVPSSSQTPGTPAQQAFISQIAPGAMAAQSRYGVPAAVTIAQAIDESGWGQSELATRDHNLFGIKGTGPAGTDMMPTREFVSGRWVTQTSGFRVYRNIAESIADHADLLASASSYQRAMANRQLPDAFANDLTGVYATDPGYGSSLIQIMQLYNLYRYDAASAHGSAAQKPAAHGSAAHGAGAHSSAAQGSASHGSVSQGSGTHGVSSQGSAGQEPASATAGSSSATTPLGGTAALAAPQEGAVAQSGTATHGTAGVATPAPTAGSGSAAARSAPDASRSSAAGQIQECPTEPEPRKCQEHKPGSEHQPRR